MCGCVYFVLISISGEDGKALCCLLSGRSWVWERGCFWWDSLRKTKKKARMIDCHWDSEGDVYGCHCRMNMETYCVHLISDKVRFEFLREVHLILSFWDLIICGDNVTAQKSYLYSLLSLKLTDNHVVTCLLSILSKNPSDRWLKEL